MDRFSKFKNPFFFLRHGETYWNNWGITQGQFDSALNETGQAQAKRAGEILKDQPIERIIASPLSRAYVTAQCVAAHHDNLKVSCDIGLKECHLGDKQEGPHGPWLGDYWYDRFDPSPTGGESFPSYVERVWSAMGEAVSQGPNTLIVAHGGLWIAARQFVIMEPDLERMPNALPLYVEPDGNRWQVKVLDGERDLTQVLAAS